MMEIEQKLITVYKVGDKEFVNKSEAEEYEKQLNDLLKYSYFPVTYSPDLTEGRGYYKKMIVAVENSYNRNTLLHYLVKTFGDPLEFVMGAAPIDNWIIGEERSFDSIEELKKFLDEKVICGIGDFKKQVKRKVVFINRNGQEIKKKIDFFGK
jgi:hypothetical protein